MENYEHEQLKSHLNQSNNVTLTTETSPRESLVD